jgi:hypothetical protein
MNTAAAREMESRAAAVFSALREARGVTGRSNRFTSADSVPV